MNSTTHTEDIELGYLQSELGWNKARARFLLIFLGAVLPFTLFASLLIIGIPAFVVNLWLVVRSVYRLNSSKIVLYLYEKGLIDTRRGQPIVLRYANIAKLYTASTQVRGQVFYRYVMQMQDGNQIKLGIEIANAKQVGIALEKGMLTAQLQQYLLDLERGSSIPFARLSLSAKGLSLRKKQLTWQDFAGAEIVVIKGYKSSSFVYLDIYQKGQAKFWARFFRGRFPNIALFFALCKQLRQ